MSEKMSYEKILRPTTTTKKRHKEKQNRRRKKQRMSETSPTTIPRIGAEGG